MGTPTPTDIGPCEAYDLNGDGIVNADDLHTFQETYGLSSGDPGFNAAADYNHDGVVNATDFNMFRAGYRRYYEKPCSPPVIDPPVLGLTATDTTATD